MVKVCYVITHFLKCLINKLFSCNIFLLCKNFIISVIRGWAKIFREFKYIIISSIRGHIKIFKSFKNSLVVTSPSFRKSLATLICALVFLSQSFAWLYDEYIGSGALIKVGEISHQVLQYDEDGNILENNTETQTLIYESNMSNATVGSKYIEIKNTGTLSMEYSLVFSLEGTIKTAGIMYYRLYEVTEDVYNSQTDSVNDTLLKAYAAANPIDSSIESDTSVPISNLSLINNLIKIDTITLSETDNNSKYYRLDYGVYSAVNTSLYSGDSLSVHLNVYSSQVGVITAENRSGQTWNVQNEAQFREILNSAISGDTIKLIDNVNINGIVNLSKRINIDTNGYTLNISGDLVYDFVNLGDLNIDVSGSGRLVVGNDFIINAPKAEVTIIGENKNYDIVVGGSMSVSGIQDGELDGIYINNSRIVKSTTNLLPVDLIVKSNTRLTIGPGVELGVISAKEGSTNIEVVNNGNVVQMNFSAMNLLATFTKAQIYVYNLGQIYGVLNQAGIILPSTATPYLGANNGNTLIIKGITSGDITVSGSDNFLGKDISTNEDEITVLASETEEDSYTVYIRESTVSIESLLVDYFEINNYDPEVEIASIKKLTVYTVNAQYMENEDFDFLNGGQVSSLVYLNLKNARVIDGTVVNRIKNNAMANNPTLTAVILPSSINEIGNYAFNNVNLGKIPGDMEESFYMLEIPSTITSIGNYAFNNSEYVSFKSVIPPTIGPNAFSSSAKLFVTNGVIEEYQATANINASQIYRQSNLSDDRRYFVYEYQNGVGISYVINNYLTSSTLGIPNVITYLGSNEAVTSIGENSFRNMNITLSTGVSVSLPSTVTEIGSYAFYNLNITSIALTNVEKIDKYAFYNTSLSNVIANKVKIIGSYAFYHTLISKLSLKTVETINSYAFAASTNLYEVNVGTVSYIGDYAFYDCKQISAFYFENITSSLVNNKEEIDIEIGVNAVFSNWGYYVDNRLRVYVPDGNNPSGISYLDLYKTLLAGNERYVYVTGSNIGTYTYKAVTGQLSEYTVKEVTLKDATGVNVTGYEIISYQGNDLTSSYTVPTTLTVGSVTRNVISIGPYAYRNTVVKAGETIALSNDNLINIGDYAFYGLGLNAITTNNVLSVGSYAFSGTTVTSASFINLKTLGSYALADISTLVKLNLGKVENIGNYAVSNNSNLEQLYLLNTNENIVIDGTPFANIGANSNGRLRIYVPSNNLVYYKALLNNYSDYIYATGYIIGSYINTPITYDIGTYSVRSITMLNAAGVNVTGYELVEYHGADLTSTYVIPESVTANNVTLPIISIGEGAFKHVNVTGSLSLTNTNLLVLQNNAFENLTGLAKVTMSNVYKIGDYAFNNSSITVGTFKKVLNVGSYAFGNTSSLYKLDLGIVEEIGSKAISNAPYLYLLLFDVLDNDITINFAEDAIYNVGTSTNDRMRFYVTNGNNDDGERYVNIYKNEIPVDYQSYIFSYDNLLGSYTPTNIADTIDIGAYTIREVTYNNADNQAVSGYELVEYHGSDITSFYEFPTELSLSDSKLSATTRVTNYWGSYGSMTSQIDVVIKNNGSTPVGTWKVVLDLSSGGTINSATTWDNTAVIDGTKLTITNISNNGTIAAGASKTISMQISHTAVYLTPVVKTVKEDILGSDAVNVISIGDYAYMHAKTIDSSYFDIISAYLLNIGTSSFQDNIGVRNVTTPNLINVGSYAFAGAQSLYKVSLPVLKTAGSYAFYNANGLSYLNLGKIENFEEGVLKGTIKMSQLYINNTTISASNSNMSFTVADNAFDSMGSLIGDRMRIYVPTGSINDIKYVDAYKSTLPSGLSTYIYETGYLVGSYILGQNGLDIGSYSVIATTVNGTSGWKIVEYHGSDIDSSFAFPTTLTVNSSSYSVISLGDYSYYHTSVLSTYEWNAVIPSNIRYIGNYAFYKRDIKTLTGSTLSYIGKYAFAQTTTLISVLFTTVSNIDDYAFYRNTELNTVNLGTGILTIGDFAFYNSWSENKLSAFYINTTVPPTIKENTLPSIYFGDTDPDPTIYVPYASISAYNAASYWSNYTIESIGSVYNGTYIYRMINTNEIEITGYIADTVTSLTIPNYFTINGSNYNVTSITPTAFDSASKLNNITLPRYVKNIGNGFLENNVSVKVIAVNASNLYFAAVNGVLFDKTLKTLIRFPNAYGGASYNVPTGTKVIIAKAFANVTNLRRINFNSDLVVLDDTALMGATNLATLSFTGTTPPYITGFEPFNIISGLQILYPTGYSTAYTTNIFYSWYLNYLVAS